MNEEQWRIHIGVIHREARSARVRGIEMFEGPAKAWLQTATRCRYCFLRYSLDILKEKDVKVEMTYWATARSGNHIRQVDISQWLAVLFKVCE